MNIPANENADVSRTTKVREHNDRARSELTVSPHLHTVFCKLIRTRGVANNFQNRLSEITKLVAEYSDFGDSSEGIDPYNEHDMGFFEYEGIKLIWKFDYYDKSFEFLSPDPSDLDLTRRVLTILLAEEY